jgi:hypothetical protein
MPLFQPSFAAKPLFSSALTQRLTAQATPIAAAQIAAGVPPDQAATNAASAVVDATPPELVQAAAPVYPQVTQWRVTTTIYTTGPDGKGVSFGLSFGTQDEAISYAKSMQAPGAKTVIVTQLTPSGSTSQPPVEKVVDQWINQSEFVPSPSGPDAIAQAVAEAYAMKSANSFYAQNPGLFTSFPRITPDAWATLTLGQKSDAIRIAIEIRDAPKSYPTESPPQSRPPVDPAAAAAVAEAMKPLNEFYAQNQTIFAGYGYTSAKWASLSVNQKSEAIKQVISAEAGPVQATQTPPEPQYVASRPAETTVIPTSADREQEAAAMAEVDAFYAQNRGYFEQLGYPASTWALMSLGQKSEAINKATSGTLPESNPISVDPSETPAPPTADTVAVTYDLQIEGANSGSFAKLEDAVAAALGATTPGDRFEVLYNGKTTGLRIRTTTGSVDVPADIDSQVRLLSRDKMGQFVVDAETKTAATGGGVPWWIIGGGAAAAAVASRLL